MKIREITNVLENLAPISLQESYDNSGLIVGNPDEEVDQALICLDATESIIEEAIERKCGLVIAHHPIVFRGLKHLNGKNYVERTVIKAIQNNIAIYAIHTNLDNIFDGGVNARIAEKLGLLNTEVLRKRQEDLCKLITFVPTEHSESVRQVLFSAGAGNIGNYDHCSFSGTGEGSFRGNAASNPFRGKKEEVQRAREDRIEVVLPKWKLNEVLSALEKSHPYEEVAYDVYPLLNSSNITGSGMVGNLEQAMTQDEFLNHLKSNMQASVVRYTNTDSDRIQKVAVCGGSGSFLIGDAMGAGADAYVTGDIKYHEFFDGENRMMICDIGHYESEQFTIDLLGEFLLEKIPSFAVVFTRAVTNPVKYFH
jgi:dinuclear metal center YbgI/SA1388 family protein